MSDYVELYMDQGADFSTTIDINDESTGLAQNLDGFIVTAQMRKSIISQNVTEVFVCSIPDPNTGEILMEMSASNTANIPYGTYFYDVKLYDSNMFVTSRLIEGVIFVTPSVTR